MWFSPLCDSGAIVMDVSRVHYLFSDDEADTLIEEAQVHLESGDAGSGSDGEGPCTGPLGNRKSQPVQGRRSFLSSPCGLLRSSIVLLLICRAQYRCYSHHYWGPGA